MRELTCDELSLSSGGIAPAAAVLAVATAAAGVYGAASSIYEFGKALGGLLVSPEEPTIETSN